MGEMNTSAERDNAAASRMSVWLLSVWVVGLWWLSNQFVVFSDNSDGLFYTGDALRLLAPSHFSRDLFFLAQTQGDFSLFGWFYSHLIAAWGLKPAEWVMSTLGRALWGAAAVALAHGLWRQRGGNGWLASLALMLLLPNGYDSERMFFYGTPDVTPRTWAEAWVLWSLTCWVHGRWWWCGVWLGVALLFHPLMALPGLGLLVLLLPARWRAGGLGVVAGVGALGGVFDVGPLGQLFRTFDPLWWESVVVLAGQVLVASWSPLTLMKAACTAGLLGATAWWHPQAVLRRWAGALLTLQILMLGLWWLGCVTHNVLLLQLQLWRVLWLCQLLAPALWWSSLPHWRQASLLHWAQAALVMAAVVSNSVATVWLFIPGVCLQWPRVVRALERAAAQRWILIGAVALLVMSLAVRFPEFQTRSHVNVLEGWVHGFWVGMAQEPMWTLPLSFGLALWLGWSRVARRWRWCGAGLWGGLVIGVGLSVQAATLKRVTQPLPDATALRAVVPADALTYWDADVPVSWRLLNQGQYLSTFHAPAALFSREVALEFRRRLAHLAQTGLLGTDWPEGALDQLPLQPSHYTDEPDIGLLSILGVARARLDRVAEQQRLAIDVQQIPTLCRDPILDYVLISRDLPEATWRVPYAGVPSGVVSVFKCVR